MKNNIDKYTDEVFEIILPYSSYIRVEKGAMHFLDLDLVMLFCGNAVVSIILNLVSNKLYEKYFSKTTSLYSREELEEIMEIITEARKNKPVITDISIQKKELELYLNNIGFPSEEAGNILLEISSLIEEIENDLNNGK